MKSYSVALARQHLAEVLDRAEQGEDVVIERRGVRFAVSPAPAQPRASGRRRAARVELLDPSIAAGTWSWSWSPSGGAELPVVTTERRRRRAARA